MVVMVAVVGSGGVAEWYDPTPHRLGLTVDHRPLPWREPMTWPRAGRRRRGGYP